MSQKQAKRIRRLERRVWELENLLAPEIADFRDRLFRAERNLSDMAIDAEWMPAEPKPGIIRRIVGFFGGS